MLVKSCLYSKIVGICIDFECGHGLINIVYSYIAYHNDATRSCFEDLHWARCCSMWQFCKLCRQIPGAAPSRVVACRCRCRSASPGGQAKQHMPAECLPNTIRKQIASRFPRSRITTQPRMLLAGHLCDVARPTGRQQDRSAAIKYLRKDGFFLSMRSVI